MFLKPQHEESVIGQYITYKNQELYYINEVEPILKSLEEWERKELISVGDDWKKRVQKSKQYIINNERFFNKILSEYSLSVTVFLAKQENRKN